MSRQSFARQGERHRAPAPANEPGENTMPMLDLPPDWPAGGAGPACMDGRGAATAVERMALLVAQVEGWVTAESVKWWATATLMRRRPSPRPNRGLGARLWDLGAAIRAGADPQVAVGDETVASAVLVADQWRRSADDLAGWLRGQCWRPSAARHLAWAGVRPRALVDHHGRPLLTQIGKELVPLGWAVSAQDLTAPETVARLLARRDTWPLVIERNGKRWQLTVEGVGTTHTHQLADVQAAALGMWPRSQRQRVRLIEHLRPPALTISRLQRVQDLRNQARSTDDDRPDLEQAVADELSAAALELRSWHVSIPDAMRLLAVAAGPPEPAGFDLTVSTLPVRVGMKGPTNTREARPSFDDAAAHTTAPRGVTTTDTTAPLDDKDTPTGADSTRRRVPRRYGPLVMWRQARANCGPGCFGLHATWPLLRGLGVVPSPRWHTAWYRDLLAQAARHRHQRETRPAADQPLVVVVVNPEDHLLPATIANLAGTTAVDLHVLSRCATPLAATQRWAARHGQPVTIHHGTLAPQAGPFDLAVVADDSIPWASTREGDRPTVDALVPVVDALAPGAQLVYATRFGPSVMMQHRHEYADLVRFVQATAGLAWRQRTPTRWQVAHNRWSQPAPFQVHYQWVGIRDVLTSTGLTNVEVDNDIHERPSRPLRWHPNEISLGAGSQMFRFTASVTGNEPPGPPPAADDPADPAATEATPVPDQSHVVGQVGWFGLRELRQVMNGTVHDTFRVAALLWMLARSVGGRTTRGVS